MPNVVLIPGVLGSDLADTIFSPFRSQRVWINPFDLALGGLARLQLDQAGVGPGPLAQGARIEQNGPTAAVYGPLAFFLDQAGYRVLQYGYDWRKSLIGAAFNLLGAISARFGAAPVQIVAHSLGGLVARAAWKMAGAYDRQNQITRIVTLGTPHYGSYEINRVLGRIDPTYWFLAGYQAAPTLFYPARSIAYVDATFASWPGAYELLPFRRSGPLADNPEVGELLYTASNYYGYNQWVMQSWLDAADATQQYLADAIPTKEVLSCIVGYGEQTPDGVSGDSPLTLPQGYEYTQSGDGKVAMEYATLPGIPRLFTRTSHALLPLSPPVWAGLLQILRNGLAADWTLN